MEPVGAFGPRLRRERERRRISLASIAANTKISMALLEALERDDVRRWPSGIFRRSFVRAYAEAIGVDAIAIAQEFAERFPDPADPPPAPATPPAAAPAARGAQAPDEYEIIFRVTLPRGWVERLRRWPFSSRADARTSGR